MEKKIFLTGIEASHFKSLSHTKISLSDRANFVVGRNGTGKSTILNAVSFGLTGLDIYGNKMDPFNTAGDPTAWVLLEGEMESSPMALRRLCQKKGTKTETIINQDVPLTKEVYFSLSNPRYILGLDPKGIKTVLSNIVRIPTYNMTSLIPTEKKAGIEDFGGGDSYEHIMAVEKAIKDNTAAVKKTEEQILIQKGKIAGTDTIKTIFAENGICPDEDIAETIEMTADSARSTIDVLTAEVEKQKAYGKALGAYRSACYEEVAKEFNDSLRHVRIQLEQNGKEVFIVTYDDKNVRACSNSEQLKAGLEIINALSGISDLSYPCLVDNAECALAIDLSEYPNIQQFIFAIVADEELSTWDGEDLTEIVSGITMPRTPEQLVPAVTILEGWGSKTE